MKIGIGTTNPQYYIHLCVNKKDIAHVDKKGKITVFDMPNDYLKEGIKTLLEVLYNYFKQEYSYTDLKYHTGFVCERDIGDTRKIYITEETNNPVWKQYPEVFTKCDVNGTIYYLNYRQYWNEFLLCEPFPDRKLDIKRVKNDLHT